MLRKLAPVMATLLVLVPLLAGNGVSLAAGPPPPIAWLHQFGTSGFDQIVSVASDRAGFVYAAGRVAGALPGQTSAGSYDGFLRKYDLNGNPVWTRQFGSPGYEIVHGLALDGAGGVYVSGRTTGTLPGQTALGGWDAFLKKYDTNGIEVWTRQFGTPADDYGVWVAPRPLGVFVAGHTYGTLPGQTSAGGSDTFVRMYDDTGNVVWTRQFGTSGTDAAGGVAADNSGKVYIAGWVRGALPDQTWAGNGDVFVRKYAADGTEQWTRQFGTSAQDEAWGIAVGGPGNVYVAGAVQGALPGQTYAGGPTGENAGGDAFLRTYDASGTEMWTRQFGTPNADAATGVRADSTGHVYLSGWVQGALPGQTWSGAADAFVRMYDVDGSEGWTLQMGTSGHDQLDGMTQDEAGDLYAGGLASCTLPGQTCAGGQDALIMKLQIIPPNAPPTAEANGPYSVPEGGSVQMTGSGADPEGGSLTYAWDLDNNGTFETPGQNPTFNASGLDGPASRPVTLQVCDDHLACATDGATVNITNAPPTAAASANITVAPRQSFTLTGSWTDPGAALDNPYAWTWTVVDPARDAANNPLANTGGSASYGTTVPFAASINAPGVYHFTFMVTDNDSASSSATVTVTVRNNLWVVFGTNSIFFREGSKVHSGDVGAPFPAQGRTLDGKEEATIGEGVVVPAGSAVYANALEVKEKSKVDTAYYNRVVDRAKPNILHGFSPLPSGLTAPALSAPSGSPGTQDIWVNGNKQDCKAPNTTCLNSGDTLQPGAYSELRSRAGNRGGDDDKNGNGKDKDNAKKGPVVLYMAAGDYFFENIDLGQSTELRFNGAARIYIAQRLDTDQDSFIGPASGSGVTAKNIAFYIGGINGKKGAIRSNPKSLDIGQNNTVQANLYAPNGSIVLRERTSATGAFVARDVQVSERVDVTLDSAFPQ